MPINFSKLAKVHGKVHDLKPKKNYSDPKIYSGKNYDLSKAWYVWYSFRNPLTGLLERQKNIKEGNYYKTKKERLAVLKHIQVNLLSILQGGFNPYGVEEKQNHSIEEAFEKGMDLKKLDMSPHTFKDFSSRIEGFKSYLYKMGYKKRFITSVEKIHVVEYLNKIAERSSNRNRNNTRIALSSLFTTLANNELIPENFIAKIDVKESVPQRNKTYTDQQVQDLLEHIEQVNPQLRLFILFVSYNFLRPIEVCRLTVGNIDLDKKTLKVWVKQGKFKQKIIPQLLIDELPDLSEYEPEDLLFTPDGKPGKWDAIENNRRDNFTKQFKKVKDKFGLGADYGIYSFRHYSITRLYRAFKKTATPFEVKSKLMVITGHSSMTALEKYLRDIDVELAEDYSEDLK